MSTSVWMQGIEFRPVLQQHGLPVYVCMECGAVVVDWPEYLQIHVEWHMREREA